MIVFMFKYSEKISYSFLACNLVFLASVDVEGLAGDGAIQYAFNKVMSSNFSMKAVVVNIKVNQDGITLTDNERR